LGTSQASKAVTVDSNGDLIVPDSDKYTFGAGSDMEVYHDGTNSYITNKTGALKVATGTSGVAVTIGHTTSEVTIGDNLTVTGELDAATLDISGVATASTFEPDGDTALGDNAAIGYTSAEGIIITGQGSSTDVTIKNDADATVMSIATGTTQATFAGSASGTDALVLTAGDILVTSGHIDMTVGDLTLADGSASITDKTASSATQGGSIKLASDDGAAIASGHRLGVIEFSGAEDASSTITVGARIEAITDAGWSATENGASLVFYTTDGNASQSQVLKIDSNKLATFAGDASVAGDLTISTASKGINTTSGSNVAYDQENGTTLTANNNRRGKYTLTTHGSVADDANSVAFTVQNNTVTADDIVIMNCTSDNLIEVHTYNVSSSGWDFFFVNRSGGVIAADAALVYNFIVMQ
jgi:hypothetical protein